MWDPYTRLHCGVQTSDTRTWHGRRSFGLGFLSSTLCGFQHAGLAHVTFAPEHLMS